MLTGYRLSLELADAELLPLRFTGYADVMEAAMQGSRPLDFFKYSRGHQERLKKIKNNSLKSLKIIVTTFSMELFNKIIA